VKYRHEIDGLRAIAVSSVVLYHAELHLDGGTLLQGGFLGVDIFFVISGYLITSILLREMERGTFTFAGFYERRARRILPALLLMLLVSAPAAWLHLFPVAFEEYARSLVSSIFFSSNILFWQSVGYADTAARLKPMLHTWTLAVEEQFYVLAPIALLLCWKYLRKHLFAVLLAVSLASLTLASWASIAHPAASFYLLPTRAWELLAGSLLAVRESRSGRTGHPVLAPLMAAVGLFAVVHSLIAFDDPNAHPSIATLQPIVGTMLVIWFAGGRGPVTWLLSTKPFVGIGLVSYSLYLWHQPVFAFAQHRALTALTSWDKFGCVAITGLLAFLSWLLVERPFRDRGRVSMRRFGFAGLSATVLLVGYAAAVMHGDVQGRIAGVLQTAPASLVAAPTKGEWPIEPGVPGRPGAKPSFILVGDSHANAFGPTLHEHLSKTGQAAMWLIKSGCIYTVRLVSQPDLYGCAAHMPKWRESILRSDVRDVVLFARYTAHLKGTPFDNEIGGLEFWNSREVGDYADRDTEARVGEDRFVALVQEDLNELLRAGKRLIIIYPVPEVGWHPHETAVKRLVRGEDTAVETDLAVYWKRNAKTHEIFDGLQGGEVVRIYPHELLCDKDTQKCVTRKDDVWMYADDDHLSESGMELVLDEVIKRLAEETPHPKSTP